MKPKNTRHLTGSKRLAFLISGQGRQAIRQHFPYWPHPLLHKPQPAHTHKGQMSAQHMLCLLLYASHQSYPQRLRRFPHPIPPEGQQKLLILKEIHTMAPASAPHLWHLHEFGSEMPSLHTGQSFSPSASVMMFVRISTLSYLSVLPKKSESLRQMLPCRSLPH